MVGVRRAAVGQALVPVEHEDVGRDLGAERARHALGLVVQERVWPAVLAGDAVAEPETRARGCSVKWRA